jgi:subtilisin family serine protease
VNKLEIVLSVVFAVLLAVTVSFSVTGIQAASISTQPPQVVEANNWGINHVPSFVPGVVLVGLKQGVSASMGALGAQATDSSLSVTFTELGVQAIEPVFSSATSASLTLDTSRADSELSHIYRLRLSADTDVLRTVQDLSAHPAVQYAEPDYLAHIITAPNDPEYSGQWALAKIDAPAAWDVGTGTTDAVIAIVDAGIEVTHPDLSGQLWQNPGEIAGNSIDDDNNGHVDDVYGWNLVNNNNDLSDNTGHGTEVAGIAAAATNNNVGIAGMCWQCRLMVVKVVQPGGVANYSDIAAGLVYAAQKGAKIINISLGGNSDSITLKTAIANAAQTAVVVAGAGNDSSSAPFYPAAYDDYVLAVAGTTQTDTKVSTSNYGAWVDMSAPGENIRTTFTGGGYGDASGTSVAAPFVSGLAGLLRSQHPTWSANLTRAQILNTTDNIDGVNPSYAGQLGSGRINAQKAVTAAAVPVVRFVSYAANGTTNAPLKAGTTSAMAVTLRNDWRDAASVSATLTTTSGDVTIIDANGSWGAIASGQSKANSADPFQIAVKAGGYGLNIPFTLNVVADGLLSTLTFTVTTESQAVNVSGVISADTVWTNDRTYHVTGNVLVNPGVTLTIQAGTVVKFDSAKLLAVRGTLIADGTSDRPILFTAWAYGGCVTGLPCSDLWGGSYQSNPSGGIVFTAESQPAQFDPNGNYQSGSIIRYSVIEYSLGGIQAGSAAPFISHNLIRNNRETAIGCGSCSTQLLISDNRIVYNDAPYVLNLVHGQATVRQNLIAINTGGVRVVSGHEIISNTITANTNTWCNGALCLEGPGIPTIRGNNIYGNQTPYEVVMGTMAGQIGDVNAPGNYWGTADAAAIQSRIYDFGQNSSAGIFTFTPFLTQPNPSAPPILYQLSLSPASPVGIQQVTFDLTLSRSMDQSINPVAKFYTTKRGTTTTFTKSSTGNGLPNDTVNTIAIDGNGNKWFGTSGGVGRFDGINWTTYKHSNSGLPSDAVNSIAVESGGVLWFGTMSGVARLENSTWITYTNPSAGDVRAIAVDNEGAKWFGTGFSGVLRFDGTSWTQYNTSNSGLPSNLVRSIAIDGNGTKWFGTGDGGPASNNVARFDGTNWTVYNSGNSSLPDYPVTAIAIDRDGSKWFGTGGGGAARFDGTNWTVYTNAGCPINCSGPQSNGIQSIAIASDGTKWFGTSMGLEKYDGSTWTSYYWPTFTPAKVALDGSDNKWLGGNSGAGVLWGGNDYLVTDHAHWINDHTWSATYDITSLVPRGTYTISVSSAKGADGMEIPTDTRSSFVVDYASPITDQTPPNAPSVIAGGKAGDPTTVEAMWWASDPDSTITGYRYAIGSTQGATDIVNWTTINNNSCTKSGLGLVDGRQYWVAVQARNIGGLWSASGYSAFVAGQQKQKTFLPLVLRRQ